MRDFVTHQILPNGGYILVGYLLLSFFLFWKGKINLERKSRDIRDEILVIDWDRSVVWMNRFLVPILLTISLGIYSLDIGWLADVIAFFGAIFIFFIWLGSLLQDKIYVRQQAITAVPMYGKPRDFRYPDIDKVEILKGNTDDDTRDTQKVSLKVYSKGESLKVSDKKQEIKAFLSAIRDKVDKDKFDIQNEPIASKEP